MEFSVTQLFAQFQSPSGTAATSEPSAEEAPTGESTPSEVPEVSPLSRSELNGVLNIGDSEQGSQELDVALDALVRVGILEKSEGDGGEDIYQRSEDGKLVSGQLRCSNKGFCFAIRDRPGGEDVYIHGTNLNGAWNGDRVITRVIKEGNRRRSPEGQVAAVIERANPTVVAKIKQEEDGQLKGVPLDDRLLFEMDLKFTDPNAAVEEEPEAAGNSAETDDTAETKETKDIAVDADGSIDATSQTEESSIEDVAADASEAESKAFIPSEAIPGRYVYVEVERYPLAQIPPLGRVHKVLGSDAETSMDVDLVCCKHDLPESFPETVKTAAVKVKGKLNKTDLKKRLDCREWYTLALSPEDAPAQLAYSLDTNGDGSWRLGIHITDLAHALLADHPVDTEAQDRVLATHLGSVTLPLFPERVLQQCGFVAGTDRPAISVIAHLTPEGTISEFELRLTAICCDTRLTYDRAQSILDVSQGGESEMARLLQQLLALQPALAAHRQQQGGWQLATSAVVSSTADEGNGSVLALDPQQPIAALTSELQVLANQLIAKHLKELGVPALFRVNPAPPPEALHPFLRLTENMGLGLELADPDVVTAADLQRFAQRISEADVVESGNSTHLAHQLTNVLADACEQREPARHVGLGLETYCHATAPLTRYTDLMNQRLIHDVFGRGRDRRSSRVKNGVDLGSSSCHGTINWSVLPPKRHKEWADLLEYSVEHLNDRQEMVREAETELKGLQRSGHMQQHEGSNVTGLIVGVQSYGFFVLTDPVLAEGLVHVSSLKDDWYEYRSRQQALVGRKSHMQFRLGDRVEVAVKSVDYYRQQIDLGAINGGKFYPEED